MVQRPGRNPGEAVVTVGGQSSKAMADQIMSADKGRLKSLLGQLSKADMLAVEDASHQAASGAAPVARWFRKTDRKVG